MKKQKDNDKSSKSDGNKGNLHYTNEGKRTGVSTKDGYTCTTPSNGVGICKQNNSNYSFAYDVSKNNTSFQEGTSSHGLFSQGGTSFYPSNTTSKGGGGSISGGGGVGFQLTLSFN